VRRQIGPLSRDRPQGDHYRCCQRAKQPFWGNSKFQLIRLVILGGHGIAVKRAPGRYTPVSISPANRDIGTDSLQSQDLLFRAGAIEFSEHGPRCSHRFAARWKSRIKRGVSDYIGNLLAGGAVQHSASDVILDLFRLPNSH
jgi:hypothetical protein